MTNYEKFYQRINSPEIPALNGVRFIAVFLVIFYHLEFHLVPGGHGVMLFFVLSGFLITWLMLRENEKTGAVSLKSFFKRRILRIFPAFYVYWMIALIVLLAFDKNIPSEHAVSSALYFGDYYYAVHPESNNLFTHTWSLAIEERFYLCFPFLFAAFSRNLNRLLKILAAMIVTVWLWRFWLVEGLKIEDSYIYSAFDTRIDHLLVGCLLAVTLKLGKFKTFFEIVLKNGLMPLLTLALLLCSIYFGSMESTRYKDTAGFIIEPVLMAIFIAQVILFSATSVWRWLDWHPVKYLGMISYSLYLYQQLTLYVTIKFLDGVAFEIQAICAIAVTVIMAALSYHLIEKPFLQLRDYDFAKNSITIRALRKAYVLGSRL